MPPTAWLIAGAGALLCALLWLRRAERLLRERRRIVDDAAEQLAACRERAAERYDPQRMEVLERSESIYRQAVDNYNALFRKRWARLPCALLGYVPCAEDAPSGRTL
jgi:hypothetical protein